MIEKATVSPSGDFLPRRDVESLIMSRVFQEVPGVISPPP